MVGSLSVLSAVAGAYSDNLPLLVVTGGPNSNDEARRHIIHHTIGASELNQSAHCYQPVVAKVLTVHHLSEVQSKVDEAIHLCGAQRKPVYLELSCDLTMKTVAPPAPVSPLYITPKLWTDDASLQAALNRILPLIHNAPKIALVAGSKLRVAQAVEEFAALAGVLGCGVAVMPDAKGLFSEHHAQYMGCFWGGVSSRHVQGIVESADLILLAGGVLNDYTTVGWTTLLPPQKTVHLDVKHVSANGMRFPHIHLKHVLAGLANHAPSRPESLQNFRRYVPVSTEPVADVTAAKDQDAESPLSLRFLLSELQSVVTSHVSSVIVETGDAWFMGQKLKLPDGVKYHVQMQYGSCGWALGACLGIGLAQKSPLSVVSEPQATPKRVLALIGDGSFQFTAQELNTLIRNNANVTIILLNNRTYTIEVQIHDGPYNQIVNWKYAELVEVLRDGNEHAVGVRACTNQELTAALQRSTQHTGVMLIECCISKDDCTSSLREWGSRVADANMRA
jgi:TPP-dependent 2-oxoacid decarboxylase